MVGGVTNPGVVWYQSAVVGSVAFGLQVEKKMNVPEWPPLQAPISIRWARGRQEQASSTAKSLSLGRPQHRRKRQDFTNRVGSFT